MPFILLIVLSQGASVQLSYGNSNDVLRGVQSLNKASCVTTDYRKQLIENACDSLMQACILPESINDGTGSSLRNEDLLPRYEKVFDDLAYKYENLIFDRLKSSDPKWTALKSIKWNDKLDCLKSSSDDCYRKEAKSLSLRIAKENFSDLNLGSLFQMEVISKRTTKADRFDLSAYRSLIESETDDLGLMELRSSLSKGRSESLQVLDETELNKKVEKSIFPGAKEALKKTISAAVVDPKVRDLLLKKIDSIQYGGNQCNDFNQSTRKALGASGILEENAYFTPGTLPKFQICNAWMMKNSSEFALAQTIMHELSHQIDPCKIAQTGFLYSDPSNREKSESDFPFTNLLSCLRSPTSIGAGREEWMLPKQKRAEYLQEVKLQMNQTANAFCWGDQITESFADWMAAESLPRYMKDQHSGFTRDQFRIGYGNALRNLCTSGGLHSILGKFDTHPLGQMRLDRLLLVQPEIRKQMGCEGMPKDIYGGMGTSMPGSSPQPAAIHCSTGSTETFTTMEKKWENTADFIK